MADNEWKSASWKKEEDHSPLADELLAKLNATTIPVLLRSSGTVTLDDFLDEMLVLEKKCRLGSDTISTQRIATEVIKICRKTQKYDLMLTHLESLVKRRAQMKQVQSSMVSEAALALATEGDEKDGDMTEARRLEILSKLEYVTNGKIHVELEHARFTVELAAVACKEGRKKEASDQLAAIQVETITNMPRLEKLKILLLEIELSMDIDDLHRAQVMSRKINHRALAKDDSKEIKISYFKLMNRYYLQKDAPLHQARCWHEIYLTASDADDKRDALSRVLVLCLVCPHMTAKEIDSLGECAAFSPHSGQSNREEWLVELAANKLAQEELVTVQQLVKQFTTEEIIRDSTAKLVSELMGAHAELIGTPKYQGELRNRVSEHDLLVVAKHYSRIHLRRLSELVGLTEDQCEKFVNKLVTSDSLYAKIDRVDSVVNFEKKKNPLEVQALWNSNVEKCVGLIDHTCHLISKERMLAAAHEQLNKSKKLQQE